MHLGRIRVRDDGLVTALVLVADLLCLELWSDQRFHHAQNGIHWRFGEQHLDWLSALQFRELEYRVDETE